MIYQNAVRYIPEDKFYVSTHRHDFVGIGSTGWFIDGGRDYIRTSGILGNPDIEDYCLFDTDSMETIVDRLLWGVYDIENDRHIHKRMWTLTKDHLSNIMTHIRRRSMGSHEDSIHYKVAKILTE